MTDHDNDDFGTYRPSREAREPAGKSARASQQWRPSPPVEGRQEPQWNVEPRQQPAGPEQPSPQSGEPIRPAAIPKPVPLTGKQPGESAAPPLYQSPARIEPQPHSGPDDEAHLPRIARSGPTRPVTARGSLAAAVPPPPRQADDYPATLPLPKPTAHARRRLENFDDEDDEPGRNWLKIIGISAASLLTIAGAAAVTLLIYTPVDLVRDRLIKEVKTKTGRDLIIGSKPSVSLWPNVAVSLGDVTLSNPPGMAGPPLIKMQRLNATIQFWPLLQRRVQLDQLVLQAPQITLVVDGQGRQNWDFADALPAQFRRTQYAQAGHLNFDQLPEDLRDFARGSGAGRRAATASSDGISLGRVRIVDGTVRHFDERSGLAEEATGINLTIDAPDLAGPMQAAGLLNWHGESIRVDTRVIPASALLSGTAAQMTAAINSGPLQFTYSGTFAAPRGGPPRVTGQLTAKAPSLVKAATWLGRPIAGESANGPLNFKGRVALSGNKASFADAALQLQGLNLTGALDLTTDGVRPKLTGAIRVAEFNPESLGTLRVLEPASRQPLRPTFSPTPAGQPPQSIEDLLKNPVSAKPQVRGFTARDGWGEMPLDLTVLALADADVKVAFNRIALSKFQFGPGHATVHLSDRALKLTLDDMTLHDGKARGTITIDATAARTTTAVNLLLDGVAMQPMLKDAGADGLDGKAKITLVLNGAGRTERQIVDSLAGKAEILMARGAIIGHDFGAMVRGITQGRIPKLDRDPAARTEFTDFGASFTVAKGIADNRDFRVVTREVRAIGAGQIALGPRNMDFTVRPKLLSGAQAPAGLNLANIDIPIRIVGPLDKPNITADFSGVLKDPSAVVDAVKSLNTDEVQDTVKGLLKGDEASKAKAKDFLNNLLKR